MDSSDLSPTQWCHDVLKEVRKQLPRTFSGTLENTVQNGIVTKAYVVEKTWVSQFKDEG